MIAEILGSARHLPLPPGSRTLLGWHRRLGEWGRQAEAVAAQAAARNAAALLAGTGHSEGARLAVEEQLDAIDLTRLTPLVAQGMRQDAPA
ncbi:MAG: hypothetical protein U0Q15_12535 [Kineosporiaceae bacterium]